MSVPQTPYRDILLGSWSLLEYKTTNLNGEETIYPMGQSPRGILVYTPDGYMSAQLLSQSPTTRPSTEFAVNDYVAYSGRFETFEFSTESSLHVNHLVTVASFPDWIGQVQSRIARFDDEGLLELRTASPIFLADPRVDLPMDCPTTRSSAASRASSVASRHSQASQYEFTAELQAPSTAVKKKPAKATKIASKAAQPLVSNQPDPEATGPLAQKNNNFDANQVFEITQPPRRLRPPEPTSLPITPAAIE
ncbi:Lipocalin-like domain-containing protein [Aspergillus affinis]|uniref:Lipocalin-like domain-containing protein n=1 Tax=Aspergillus affinis TaxID=1070780 RepID=UPI0022FDD661|nr:Lipocalin-like domain-containing protein [Aspergillus affinis]KAI9045128.1 Lipocalin-like domain-containing protein [Aspergillus affinis]